MKKAIFYHAGCPVCVEAEGMVAQAIDPNQYELEIVHFAQHPDRVAEAETIGVKSVPALVLDRQVFHINFGASMALVEDLILALNTLKVSETEQTELLALLGPAKSDIVGVR